MGLEHVQAFLDQPDDEPLLWEAKGTDLDKNEIRRQVCAFANGHEGGFLILGADRPKTGRATWSLDGVEFPDEPRPWITDVISDPERGVRPRPDFNVHAWKAPDGHVAVVRVTPTATPPCLANGTVYERLPGKTQTVRDPFRLTDLFSRGDHARRAARERADRAALTVMEQLEGESGVFCSEPEPEPDASGDDATFVRFTVGVAATGNPADVASRLFKQELADEVWTRLMERPTGLPPGFGTTPAVVTWSQEALTWRHQSFGLIDLITVVRASWDGAVAVGQKLLAEDAYVNEFATARLEPEWRLADHLVKRLRGFGDVYVTVVLAGGPFERRNENDRAYTVMRRGPMLAGVDDDQVASLGRELRRALGGHEPEP